MQAQVTLQNDQRVCLEAEVVNASGRGMRLLVDRRLPLNAPVQVRIDSRILLGEVCYSVAEGDRWAVGVTLEQVLADVNDLARLVDALLQRAFTSIKY